MIKFELTEAHYYELVEVAYVYNKYPTTTSFETDIKMYFEKKYNLQYVKPSKKHRWGYLKFNTEKDLTIFLLGM